MDKRTAYLPEKIDRNNWGKLFTNAELWQPVVRSICGVHGFLNVGVIEEGYPGSYAVFIVDKAVVVKLFPPIFAADFERELIVYEVVQDRLPHMPRILAQGVYQDRIDWPYIILSFCPGEPIREVAHLLREDDKNHIGRELGHLIRQLHDGPIPKTLSVSWKQWQDFLLENRQRTLKHLRQEGPFGDSVIDEIENFLTDTERIWLKESQLCLINADLTDDHLLLVETEYGWRVSAVIDWADAEVGMPTYEWIPLWYGLCQQDKALFRHILVNYDPQFNMDESFSIELLVFTFLHRFGGEIVVHVLNQLDEPPINRLSDLQAYFCPTP